jgi:hypothetical protein
VVVHNLDRFAREEPLQRSCFRPDQAFRVPADEAVDAEPRMPVEGRLSAGI